MYVLNFEYHSDAGEILDIEAHANADEILLVRVWNNKTANLFDLNHFRKVERDKIIELIWGRVCLELQADQVRDRAISDRITESLFGRRINE